METDRTELCAVKTRNTRCMKAHRVSKAEREIKSTPQAKLHDQAVHIFGARSFSLVGHLSEGSFTVSQSSACKSSRINELGCTDNGLCLVLPQLNRIRKPIKGGGVRDRETETETHTHRDRERQTDRDRETDRQRQRDRERLI